MGTIFFSFNLPSCLTSWLKWVKLMKQFIKKKIVNQDV